MSSLVAIGVVCVVGFIALCIGIWWYVDDVSAKVFGCVSFALLLILSVNFGAGLCLYSNSKKEAAPVSRTVEPEPVGTSCCPGCYNNSGN